MAIKKYTSSAWVPTTYRKFGTETDTITSLPAQIIGDGQPITSCQISGNTVQDGTPTPEAPVDVVGCGVKTGNLFDLSTATNEFINSNGAITSTTAEDPYYLSDYISADNVTISVQYKETAASEIFSVGVYDSSKSFIRRDVISNNSISYENVAYIRVNYRDKNCQNVMINAGSTAKPYQPYGFKLPLTCGGTEYPIYLGQVETTRRVKKLVLTGEEGWVYRSGEPSSVFFIEFVGAHFINNHGLCTHYLNQDSGTFDDIADKHVLIHLAAEGTKSFIGLRDSSFPTGASGRDSLKHWLATQYANGTPVTVWYATADPETAVVNEPLMKIGDYADTVTATNVPTTGTPENFDVGTTLKPSEVQLTYHGWHEHTDTKYTQGE